MERRGQPGTLGPAARRSGLADRPKSLICWSYGARMAAFSRLKFNLHSLARTKQIPSSLRRKSNPVRGVTAVARPAGWMGRRSAGFDTGTDFAGEDIMRIAAALLATVLLALTPALPAVAQEAPPGVKGLFLLADYPAVTVRPGTTSTINLRLQNYALPPERLALSVSGVPSGWTATLLGGGQPVAAAMPATNQSVSLQLRLDVPAGAAMGTQTVTINAKG